LVIRVGIIDLSVVLIMLLYSSVTNQ